jgi:hypothetical protein
MVRPERFELPTLWFVARWSRGWHKGFVFVCLFGCIISDAYQHSACSK